MADSFVDIKGLRELDRILTNELPKAAGNRALNAAMTAGAREVVLEARVKAPKDTGRLKRNVYSFKIRSNQTQHSASRAVSVRNKAGKLGNSSKGKRSDPKNVWYWWWVEFGTRKMAARPFLRPALDAAASRAIDSIRKRLLERVIVETVKRVRPKTPR